MSKRESTRSETRGVNTSSVEIANIDAHGVWVFVCGKEYFLPHADFPWFKRAALEDVLAVELLHGNHLHWPKLDVDLTIESIEDPGKFPLVAK